MYKPILSNAREFDNKKEAQQHVSRLFDLLGVAQIYSCRFFSTSKSRSWPKHTKLLTLRHGLFILWQDSQAIRVQRIIEERNNEITDAWNKHLRR